MSIFSPFRSIHRLTQLERLDLGSNEFSDVVRLIAAMFYTLIMECCMNEVFKCVCLTSHED